MKLLSFAHKNEASSFLEAFNYTPLAELKGLFKSHDHFLLITGEGQIPALGQINKAISLLIYKYQIQLTEHINMGICGGLRESIELGKIYRVRSLYAEKSFNHMQFQSYHTNQGDVDLVSSYERVKSDKHKDMLSAFAHLVDREAWSLARASQEFKIDFNCYKMVSDFAGNDTNCFNIQEQAHKFSDKLYDFYKQLEDQNISADTIVKSTESALDFSNFHITASQKNKLDKLLQSACIAFSKTPEWVLAQLPMNEIENLKPAKKRTSALLFELECLLNPVKKNIVQSMNEVIKNTPKNFHVNYDPEFENTEINIKLSLHSEKQKQELANYLKDFPLNKLQSIINGDENAI